MDAFLDKVSLEEMENELTSLYPKPETFRKLQKLNKTAGCFSHEELLHLFHKHHDSFLLIICFGEVWHFVKNCIRGYYAFI